MKTKIILYVLSVIAIGISILLLIEFPDSGRYSAISGFLMMVGLVLNAGAFILSFEKKKELVTT